MRIHHRPNRVMNKYSSEKEIPGGDNERLTEEVPLPRKLYLFLYRYSYFQSSQRGDASNSINCSAVWLHFSTYLLVSQIQG
jgi:hypothetical protein